MEQAARQVVFTGRVQGVGFRYTTHRIAGHYEVAGYVKNCSNGTVQALFQGTKANIQACLDDIQDAFSGYIRDMRITDKPFNPQCSDFRIAY